MSDQRPTPLKVVAQNVPAELRALPRWVTWEYEPRGKNEWDKPPICPLTNWKCNANDPRMQVAFDVAVAHYQRHRLDGIGFVLRQEDPVTAIDLDQCRNRDTGEVEPWALAII